MDAPILLILGFYSAGVWTEQPILDINNEPARFSSYRECWEYLVVLPPAYYRCVKGSYGEEKSYIQGPSEESGDDESGLG